MNAIPPSDTLQAIAGRLLLVIGLATFSPAFSQPSFTSRLYVTGDAPANLLASRSFVLYDYALASDQLGQVQKAFQQIGIDAVGYLPLDVVLAGKDVTRAFASYFLSRQIRYLIFFEKTSGGFQLIFAPFDQKSGLVDVAQPAWRVQKDRLADVLQTVFQDTWRGQKKQNFLINEFPEMDIAVDVIKGNRQEFYAIDLKVDNLAVPKFGNEAMDKELEQFFQSQYPLQYKITEANADEQELRKQGLSYVLCYVHTRGKAAKEILGYDMTKSESAYASVTFPAGQLQLKTIPAEKEIYKFYFRHISNGNIFLGTKWDADITWQDALRNHIMGFKMEVKIN